MPEVMEFYRMNGEVDCLLRVVVPDIAAYDAFYERLIEIAPLGDVTSRFAMEAIKYTTALPIRQAAAGAGGRCPHLALSRKQCNPGAVFPAPFRAPASAPASAERGEILCRQSATIL